MKSEIEYFDEIGYCYQIDRTNRKIIKYVSNPEEMLIQKQNEQEKEDFEEKQELMKEKMKEIFYNTFKNILTQSEQKFLRQMLFGIDKYYPYEETQRATAKKLKIKREYYGLLLHRVYKKIQKNKYLRLVCQQQLNEYKSELKICSNNS